MPGTLKCTNAARVHTHAKHTGSKHTHVPSRHAHVNANARMRALSVFGASEVEIEKEMMIFVKSLHEKERIKIEKE